MSSTRVTIDFIVKLALPKGLILSFNPSLEKDGFYYIIISIRSKSGRLKRLFMSQLINKKDKSDKILGDVADAVDLY